MMLAAISPSMPPPSLAQSREHLTSPTMATLTLLPQRQQPSAFRTADSAAQRPKLHINTQQLRTFGKGSSLRLDTLSAVSPTARNTFSNAYEPPASAAPTLDRPSKPRLCIDSSVCDSRPPAALLEKDTPSSAATPCSGSTATSTESATISIPYKQPHNLTSILSNSAARQLLPRKMAPARPLFPATKKVSFRTPLEEEIKTIKYTMAHSDIESSISSLEESTTDSEASIAATSSLSIPSSTSDASSPSLLSPSDASTSSAFSSLESSPRPKGPRTGEKRDSSSSESDSEDSCPETPVAGRRKRRRDWRWTLGPIKTSSSTSEASTSDDDTS